MSVTATHHLLCFFVGVPLLMSETFFNLLDSANKYRCRKLDQLILLSAENDSLVDPREILDSGEKMSIVSEFSFIISFYLACLKMFIKLPVFWSCKVHF